MDPDKNPARHVVLLDDMRQQTKGPRRIEDLAAVTATEYLDNEQTRHAAGLESTTPKIRTSLISI